MFDFEGQRAEWRSIPNDIDYFPAEAWLKLTDRGLRRKVLRMERDRYESWRNWAGLWRRSLGLDDTYGKVVLDFGCGAGIEALQFAKLGNRLMVADINPESVALAERVLGLFGFETEGLLVSGSGPYVVPSRPVDVFYANGVLHHTPEAIGILRRASELLSPGGEVRLLLYTDAGWRVSTETEPPLGDPCEHPMYWRFVRFFDSVGAYAEPWWPEKLAAAVQGFLELVEWTYLTVDGRFGVAVLRPVG